MIISSLKIVFVTFVAFSFSLLYQLNAQVFTRVEFLELSENQRRDLMHSGNSFTISDLITPNWEQLIQKPEGLKIDYSENFYNRYNDERRMYILHNYNQFVICPGLMPIKTQKFTLEQWNSLPEQKKILYRNNPDKFEIID